MVEFLVSLVTAGVVFGLIDTVWLSLVAKKFYRQELGKMLKPKPNMFAAVLFYVVYLIGLTVFVIMPALAANSLVLAAGLGALFGFVAYSTYDLTNLATLKGFSTKLAIIDLIWGTVVTKVVAIVTYLCITNLGY